MKTRIAEERLPLDSLVPERFASMRRNNAETLTPSALAMRERQRQKGSSSDMLVEWPAIVTDRFMMPEAASAGATQRPSSLPPSRPDG